MQEVSAPDGIYTHPSSADVQPRDMSVSHDDAPLPPLPNPDALEYSTTFVHLVLALPDITSQTRFDAALTTQARDIGLAIPAPVPPPPPPQLLVQSGRSTSDDSPFSVPFSRASPESLEQTPLGFNLPRFTDRPNRSRDSVLSQPLPVTNSLATVSFFRTPSLPPTEHRSSSYSPENLFKPSSPHRHLLRGLSRLRLRRQRSHKNDERDDTPVGSQDAVGRSSLSSISFTQSHISLASHELPGAELSGQGLYQGLDQGDLVLAESNLAQALAIPEYRSLRSKHRDQRDRFLRWSSHCRSELIAASDRHKHEETLNYNRHKSFKSQQHAAIVANVEDKHIEAEAELRSAQESERRNADTALRHMEAYCRGRLANGDPHNRAISEQDRLELAKARRSRDNMHVRHQSAINVLRGEQDLRAKARLGRQEAELKKLQSQHEGELEHAQQDLHSTLVLWDQQTHYRKALLERWWLMETQICLKTHASTVNLPVDACLAPLSWSPTPSDDEQCPESSQMRVDSVALS